MLKNGFSARFCYLIYSPCNVMNGPKSDDTSLNVSKMIALEMFECFNAFHVKWNAIQSIQFGHFVRFHCDLVLIESTNHVVYEAMNSH